MKKSNLKVWQYFSWSIAGVALIIAFASRPNSNELAQVQSQIRTTDKVIKQSDKAPGSAVEESKAKTFDLTAAKQKATDKLQEGLSQALGGYKDSAEYNQHRQKLDNLFGSKFDTELYKLNGLPDETYSTKATAKFKFTLEDSAKVNVGFSDWSDPAHAKAVAIVRYKPNYLKYGVIKIINFDYNLQTQKVNTATLDNLKNPQLKGYFIEDE
ncbi:hypothetical protein JF75_05490 [Lactobacillus kimbladii]|uniref:Uncharacterized protein n=1 Tax=Lactobacillus kimbladii TaxID=1218506 RepID=A0A0F4LLE4_9LACO|nr:hypothetical protein [Lactobacillus kimbladii]KJY59089.1 hypothetical protein JF75_05490 [Lactobacillus kimbladii]